MFLAIATPAYASVRVCETFGNYCVGAPSLVAGAPVMETSGGRAINEVKNSGGHYALKFADNTSLCVTAGANLSVYVDSCTATGTSWDKTAFNGHYRWVNRVHQAYLTGHNNGTQMFVSGSCSTNCFQSFLN